MGNRIFYSCLGVALAAPNSLPSSVLEGVQSVGITSSRNIDYILSYGDTTPTDIVQSTPDIKFSYSEIVQNIESIDTIPGFNSYQDLYMLIGDDTNTIIDPTKYVLCKYVLLNSITYNFSVDGIFTADKEYSGFSRYICPYVNLFFEDPTPGYIPSGASGETPEPDPNCPVYKYDKVGQRQHFSINGSSLPAVLLQNNALQSINISYNINRKQITESGTKTPYGSSVVFPLETSITFDVISQNLDGYNDTFQTNSCQGLLETSTDMTIKLCNCNNIQGSITINDAILQQVNYAGGDATGSNQTITFEYKSYDDLGIQPLIEFPSDATTGCS